MDLNLSSLIKKSVIDGLNAILTSMKSELDNHVSIIGKCLIDELETRTDRDLLGRFDVNIMIEELPCLESLEFIYEYYKHKIMLLDISHECHQPSITIENGCINLGSFEKYVKPYDSGYQWWDSTGIMWNSRSMFIDDYINIEYN